MKLIFAFIVIVLSATSYGQKNYHLIIGTYTSGSSDGIYVHHFNTKNGDSYPVDSIKTSNPSFLDIAPGEGTIYAVNENAGANGKAGGVSSFSFDQFTGHLKLLSTTSSEGNHPCYIAVDKTGKWVAVGNYSSGNFTVLPVLNGGGLGTSTVIVQHEGKGPDKRQASPHVHSVVFSPGNRFLLVNDLGIDKIMIYSFDEHTGSIKPADQPFIDVEAGSGPRHLAFHPKKSFVYLLNELKGTVDVFRYHTKNGSLFALQTISSLAADFKGFAGSADIHVSSDGKFLYASNRGDANNIAIYRINKRNGKLALINHQPVLGKAPRNFSMDPSGKFLLCANQDTDEIVIFHRNKRSGLLTDAGKRISISKPVCIKWALINKK